MKIVGALLVRNEADRYLKEVLENVHEYCDEVVVLDDGSTDDSREVAAGCGATVVATDAQSGFWGTDESTPRAELWRRATELAGSDGWIYISDADHLLFGLTRDDLHVLCSDTNFNAWGFRLFDCWDSYTQHRVDGYWQAWRSPRAWLFRALPDPEFDEKWDARGIHSGHCPSNYPTRSGVVPGVCGILHCGYIDRTDRARKSTKYLDLAPPQQ